MRKANDDVVAQQVGQEPGVGKRIPFGKVGVGAIVRDLFQIGEFIARLYLQPRFGSIGFQAVGERERPRRDIVGNGILRL